MPTIRSIALAATGVILTVITGVGLAILAGQSSANFDQLPELESDDGAEHSTSAPTTPDAMIELFAQHAARCDSAEAIWGGDLCVPLLLADPDSRAVYASSADPSGALMREGDLFRGELPTDINIANTSVDWAGQTWAMVMLPLPTDPQAALSVALHESFHARQADFGLPNDGGAANHMDTRLARIWFRLELAALARALRAEDDTFGHHYESYLASALAFRAERWRLIDGARAAEIALENHEGLAQYTGDALAYSDGAAARVADALGAAASGDSNYARGFAYATGPAYGLLLDRADPDWTQGFDGSSNLADLLSQAMGWGPLTEQFVQQVERSQDDFGYQAVLAQEDARDAARTEENEALIARFVDGPNLEIPLRQMQFSFDPNRVRPLAGPDGEIGSIYPTATVTDAWGRIEITDGALIYSTWDRMTVPLSHQITSVNGELRAAGWTLVLAEGWELDQDGMHWRVVPSNDS